MKDYLAPEIEVIELDDEGVVGCSTPPGGCGAEIENGPNVGDGGNTSGCEMIEAY